MIFDQIIYILDLIDQGTQLFLVVIETLDSQTTHGRAIHLFAYLRIDVNNIIGDLKRMLDVEIHFHDVLGSLHPTWGMGAEIESCTK